MCTSLTPAPRLHASAYQLPQELPGASTESSTLALRLSQCQALKQICLEICAAAVYSFCYLRRAKLLALFHMPCHFPHTKKEKGKEWLLSDSCSSGSHSNSELTGGGRTGRQESRMRRGIPKLMLTLRSLLKMKKILKNLSDSSNRSSDVHFFKKYSDLSIIGESV